MAARGLWQAWVAFVGLLAMVGVHSPSAGATPGGYTYGLHVVDAHGRPLAGMTVEFKNLTFGVVSTATTDATGTATVQVPGQACYVVDARDPIGVYATTFLPANPTAESFGCIPLVNIEFPPGSVFNMTMPVAVTVTGSVAGSLGASGLQVIASPVETPSVAGSAVTDASGQFSMRLYPNWSYRLLVVDPRWSTSTPHLGYPPQLNGGVGITPSGLMSSVWTSAPVWVTTGGGDNPPVQSTAGLALQTAFCPSHSPGANLHAVSFMNCDLTGADLSNANLGGADFTGATLRNVVFTGANISSAQFASTIGINASIGLAQTQPDWSRTSFYRAGAAFVGADLRGHRFAYADLRGTSFSGADLTGSDFTGARFALARLDGAKVALSTFTGATGMGVVNFSSTNLYASNLKGVNLAGADLSTALLQYARLDNANLTSAKLTGSAVTGATFVGTNFSGANLGGWRRGATPPAVSNAVWTSATCADGTQASVNGNTCEGHL